MRSPLAVWGSRVRVPSAPPRRSDRNAQVAAVSGAPGRFRFGTWILPCPIRAGRLLGRAISTDPGPGGADAYPGGLPRCAYHAAIWARELKLSLFRMFSTCD